MKITLLLVAVAPFSERAMTSLSSHSCTNGRCISSKSLTDKSAEMQNILERMSKSSQHVRFRSILGLSADPKAMLFKVFHAGEDAVKQPDDIGNHIAFRRWERSAAFQMILKSQGEPHSNQTSFSAFKDQEAT